MIWSDLLEPIVLVFLRTTFSNDDVCRSKGFKKCLKKFAVETFATPLTLPCSCEHKQKQETVQKSKIDLAIIIIRHFALLRAQNSFVFASGALAFLSSNAGCALSVDKYDLVLSLDQDEAATQS